jgi:protein-S-isoprenylcysteine O-methyltransferase Ste14
MPIEKRDPTFLQRFIVPLVVIVLVAALLGLLAMRVFWEPHPTWVRCIPFCLVLVSMLGALFTDRSLGLTTSG